MKGHLNQHISILITRFTLGTAVPHNNLHPSESRDRPHTAPLSQRSTEPRRPSAPRAHVHRPDRSPPGSNRGQICPNTEASRVYSTIYPRARAAAQFEISKSSRFPPTQRSSIPTPTLPWASRADGDGGDQHRHDGRRLLRRAQRDPRVDQHHPAARPLQGRGGKRRLSSGSFSFQILGWFSFVSILSGADSPIVPWNRSVAGWRSSRILRVRGCYSV
jgi:hypothetical protein